MRVSVVIPTYNRARIISQALESALAQTYRDFEIVVLDDGSTDNTAEIVRGFKDDKIRYICYKENRGCSAACNSGISAARGDLIAFLDSDDLWTSDKLERQVGFLSRHPETDAVFCDTRIVTESEIIPSLTGLMKHFSRILERKQEAREAREYVLSGREMYLCLLEEVPIKPTALLAKRELYEQAGPFDESWPSGTDWDMFLRFSRFGCLGYIDLPLAIQRRAPDATHLKFREQDKLFLASLFLQEKVKLKNDPEALAAVNRGILNHYNDLGWHYMHSGQRSRSVSAYIQGFKETGKPKMLLRAAAAILPLSLRGTLRNVVNKA